ncbi:MAG: hypothetical protein V8R52_12260 [Coprobacter fastidiosus]
MFNEFRNPQKAKILLEAIHKITRHSWYMEICGGQTRRPRPLSHRTATA